MTAVANKTKPCVSIGRFKREAPGVIETLIKDRDDYPDLTMAAIARHLFEYGDELEEFQELVFSTMYGGVTAQKMEDIVKDLDGEFIKLMRTVAKLPPKQDS